jgi:peroxiredoxin
MKWRSLAAAISGHDVRPLREQLAERKANIEKYVPAATREVYARVVEELRQSGMVERALRAGAKAPDFELSDHDGAPVASSTLLERGRLVVCFFRGRWDPFCCCQMEALNEFVSYYEKAGAALVGISPQTVPQSYFMHDQHRLLFPLLSDAGNRFAREFRLVYRVPEEQQAIYRRVFINLPNANGDESWGLPIPATYILDRDATILYASADPDYTVRPEPAEILKRLLEFNRASEEGAQA